MDVRMPDGTVITNVPDGTTQSELMRRYTASQQPAADQNLGGTLNVAGHDTGISIPAGLESFLVGAGKAATRIGQGVQQAYYGARDTINGPSLSSLITGYSSPQAAALAAKVADEEKLYKPLEQAHPLATGLGEALPAMAVPVGGAGNAWGALGKAALAGAAPGALEYGNAQERAMRAGLGGAAGLAGGAAGYGLGRLINPFRGANPLATDETRAIADAAKIKLTPAQATGSNVLASLDGTLATLPGSSGVMAKLQQGQREGFNRAATSMLGEPPATSIANELPQLAKQNIGGRIQGAAKGVQIPVDMPLVNDLAAVESKYAKNLSPDQRPIVGQYINDILGQGDSFDGAAYQAWRSRIGARAQSTQDSELKGALKGVQGALDSAFDRAAPGDAADAMKAARGQYRNFKTLEPLLEKAAMSSSNIPPAQVMSRALATKNTQGQMQALAQLGQAIGKDYPNSGTVPRLFWMEAMRNPLSIPLMGPMAGTAWAAARAIHNPVGRAYLTNEAISPELEKLLMRGGGLLGYGGANGGGLLP